MGAKKDESGSFIRKCVCHNHQASILFAMPFFTTLVREKLLHFIDKGGYLLILEDLHLYIYILSSANTVFCGNSLGFFLQVLLY